jgi:hypothetical protein
MGVQCSKMGSVDQHAMLESGIVGLFVERHVGCAGCGVWANEKRAGLADSFSVRLMRPD